LVVQKKPHLFPGAAFFNYELVNYELRIKMQQMKLLCWIW